MLGGFGLGLIEGMNEREEIGFWFEDWWWRLGKKLGRLCRLIMKERRSWYLTVE